MDGDATFWPMCSFEEIDDVMTKAMLDAEKQMGTMGTSEF